MPFINEYGLMNAKEADIVAENTALWSVEYYILCDSQQLTTTCLYMMDNLNSYLDIVTVGDGVYHNQAVMVETKERYTSPDQLIAYLSILHLNKDTEAIKEIRSYLKRHLGTYDNTQPSRFGVNFDRFMHPVVYFYAGALLGYKLDKLMLSIINAYSMKFGKGTSGRLKVWVMQSILNGKALEGNEWLDIFRIYHYEMNYIREMAEIVYGE